jgi:hypothetical protein
VERVEDRDTVRTAHHGLAVEGERSGTQQRRGDSDRRVAAAPVVAVAGEQANGSALAADLETIAVVLDLVHPAGPRRRLDRATGCRVQ